MDTFYFTKGKENLIKEPKEALACKSIGATEIFYYIRINARNKQPLTLDDLPDRSKHKVNLDLISTWKKINEKCFNHYLKYLENKQPQNYRYAVEEMIHE